MYPTNRHYVYRIDVNGKRSSGSSRMKNVLKLTYGKERACIVYSKYRVVSLAIMCARHATHFGLTLVVLPSSLDFDRSLGSRRDLRVFYGKQTTGVFSSRTATNGFRTHGSRTNARLLCGTVKRYRPSEDT